MDDKIEPELARTLREMMTAIERLSDKILYLRVEVSETLTRLCLEGPVLSDDWCEYFDQRLDEIFGRYNDVFRTEAQARSFWKAMNVLENEPNRPFPPDIVSREKSRPRSWPDDETDAF